MGFVKDRKAAVNNMVGRIKNAVLWLFLTWLSVNTHSLADYHFTTLVGPPGYPEVNATAISGSNIVGIYTDSGGEQSHGFIYNGKTYTELADPIAFHDSTYPLGISGSDIVGFFEDAQENTHGFLCRGGAFTTLDEPLAVNGTFPLAISGTNIVGYYLDAKYANHGFFLSGTTYSTPDDPAGYGGSTQPLGISGTNIVGSFFSQGKYTGGGYGFLLSGTTYTTLVDPLAVNPNYTNIEPEGISGAGIVGTFLDANLGNHGFLLSRSTYRTLDDLLGYSTEIRGISGNRMVGIYYDSYVEYAMTHSFVATPGPVVDGVETGEYTFFLTSTGTSPSVPGGTGCGTLIIAPKGGFIMAGRLPDGSAFLNSGALVNGTAGAQLLVYDTVKYPFVSRPGESGLLLGTITFARHQDSDFTGNLQWVKPQQRLGEYKALINTTLNVTGSFYGPGEPGARSVLPAFTSGTLALSDTSTLSVSGSGVLTKAVTLTPSDQLQVKTRGSDKLSVTINPSTGVFHGTFLYPGSKPTPADITGVLFQDSLSGGGFFLGPNGSGTVTLSR